MTRARKAPKLPPLTPQQAQERYAGKLMSILLNPPLGTPARQLLDEFLRGFVQGFNDRAQGKRRKHRAQ